MWGFFKWRLDCKVLQELEESDRRIQRSASNIRKRIVYKETIVLLGIAVVGYILIYIVLPSVGFYK